MKTVLFFLSLATSILLGPIYIKKGESGNQKQIQLKYDSKIIPKNTEESFKTFP